MNTIELSAALGQAQVVENLKNFVGVDAQGAAALMTPERLAAVAGGILHSIGVNHTLKDNADDIIETGCYFINLYNESKINFPHKGAFASLLVCSYKETECVFQHLFCEDGKCFIRAHKQGSWTTWKVVGAS